MGDVLRVADLFCGAGGTSQGLGRACERLQMPVELIAVNHWDQAVETHRLNHPWATHYCARVESLDPRVVVPGGKLHLIVAGVECTHHSRARGGKPMSDQSRASAWHVLHWAEQTQADEVLIENVPEWVQWGPLDEEQRPIADKRGATFRALVGGFESLDYTCEWRILISADYGDPQERRRLFFRARRGRLPITWPVPTHHKTGAHGLERWRPVREIIDWSYLGESIFTRKRPLADRTIDRIAEGVRRFCGDYAQPFLVMLYGTNKVRSVDRPAPTITGQGGHVGLVQPVLPFLLPPDGPMRSSEVAAPRSIDRPLGTVRAERGGGYLVSPVTSGFILPHDQFTARNGLSLVDSLDRPMRTVKANNGIDNYLVSPFMLKVTHGDRPHAPRGVDEPLSTVTGKNGFAVATPFLVPHFGERPGQVPRVHGLEEPCPTVTSTKGAGSLVVPFITPYYRTGVPGSIESPLATVSTRDRFGLATAVGDHLLLDILFRMLQPRELARAQGFPDSFDFTGNKGEVVRQIGNAVPVGTAEHLCHSILASNPLRRAV